MKQLVYEMKKPIRRNAIVLPPGSVNNAFKSDSRIPKSLGLQEEKRE